MQNIQNFFKGIDKLNEEKFQLDLLKLQISTKEAECQNNIMKEIASLLVTAGIKFEITQSYNIRFMEEKENISLTEKEAEKLVKKYGMPLTVFENK